MAAVTICSDFGAQKISSGTVSTVSPSISREVMGLDAMFGCISVPAAKLLQSCPTLCDSIDCSPPGSPFPGILQARTLEWVAISFSNAWKWKVKVKLLSRVWLFETPWTAAYQAPPSMGFSRQEYWSGAPFPSPMHESEKWEWSRSVVSDSLWPHGLQPTRLLHPWDFPGKSTGVGCQLPSPHIVYSPVEGPWGFSLAWRGTNQIPLQRKLLPSCRGSVSRQPLAVSSFRVCHSCRDLSCPRWYLSWSSPHQVTEWGSGIKI